MTNMYYYFPIVLSPALVASDANLPVAARRIVWGKCLNSGQTCIAPDYVLCAGCNRDKLVAEMKKALKEFYGEVHGWEASCVGCGSCCYSCFVVFLIMYSNVKRYYVVSKLNDG